jgi:hypothetical protein
LTADSFIDELTDYFSGNYPPKVVSRMRFFAKIIPEVHLERLYEQIEQDNPANFKVSVKAIKDACLKLDVPFYDPSERRWIKVTCDACDHEYKYFPCPTDEEKLDADMFDQCPRCGFDYNFQSTYLAYTSLGFVSEAYVKTYDNRRDACAARAGEGKPWRFNKVVMRQEIQEEERRKQAVERKKIEVRLKGKTFQQGDSSGEGDT